jgi:hypothetical protein
VQEGQGRECQARPIALFRPSIHRAANQAIKPPPPPCGIRPVFLGSVCASVALGALPWLNKPAPGRQGPLGYDLRCSAGALHRDSPSPTAHSPQPTAHTATCSNKQFKQQITDLRPTTGSYHCHCHCHQWPRGRRGRRAVLVQCDILYWGFRSARTARAQRAACGVAARRAPSQHFACRG